MENCNHIILEDLENISEPHCSELSVIMNQTYAFRTSGAHEIHLFPFILNHMIRYRLDSQGVYV